MLEAVTGANVETPTDVDTEMVGVDDIEIDQPVALASVTDFPADHWEEPNSAGYPIPPPTPAAPITSIPLASIHDSVVQLTARVAAMELADRNVLGRMDTMQREYRTLISSMRAEFSVLHIDVNQALNAVHGLADMLEMFRQTQVAANPSFPAPTISQAEHPTVTAFGRLFLNSVFDPSVAPIPVAAAAGEPSVSRPFGRHDTVGSTFRSGQGSSVSAVAGPSSAPAVVASSVSAVANPSSAPAVVASHSAVPLPASSATSIP